MPLREDGEVVPGLVSLAQMPRPCPHPFRPAPDPRTSGGQGQTAPLPSVLEGSLGNAPTSFTGCGGSPPPLSCPGAAFSTPSQAANNPFIDAEVAALLEKGAIEEVPLDPPPPSFISNIFLVRKKNGGMRPVMNLKRLNAAHLDTPYFDMETPQDVRHAIRAGDWAASINLRDAYFHIPIHMEGRKFLRFGWRGPLFQFCVLPFGLFPGGFHDQVFAVPASGLAPYGRGGWVWFILQMRPASCSRFAL
jgi:hypothetical protein